MRIIYSSLVILAAASVPGKNAGSGDPIGDISHVGFISTAYAAEVSATAAGRVKGEKIAVRTSLDPNQVHPKSDPATLTSNVPVPVTFYTNPLGLAISVDGSPLLATPFTTFWDPNVTHSFSTPPTQGGNGGTQFMFVSWSDGVTTPSRTNVAAPVGAGSFTANFNARWLLTLQASPPGSGILIANPSSPDGYYDNGTQVTITAVPAPFGMFTGFTGDLSGMTNPQTVVMNTSRTVVAGFTPPAALGFFPVRPCRAVDTRPGQGKTGSFGPPALTAYTERDFPLTLSGCGLPNGSHAYSLNLTAVPSGPLNFLTAWAAGQPFPGVSTLNSPDGGIVANAAIVPTDVNGAIAVLAGNATNLLIDTNGYFAPPNGSELDFYPVVPCRIADTRGSQGKTGAFGSPSLIPYVTRTFPILQSSCNVPNSARAYSLNLTVVPQGRLDFLSIWPADQPYPGVSTLNSPKGRIVANAAIVPAAANGDVAVVAGNATDFIMDINGYFAAPGGPGALHYFAVTPCRVADTRTSQPFMGPLGPPALAAYSQRDFPIASSNCGIPNTAQAYALNFTVVPQGPLSFLSAWPAGQSFPGVSTLNSPAGMIIANSAIVPAGTNGAITVVAGNPTGLIIDVNGYFAP